MVMYNNCYFEYAGKYSEKYNLIMAKTLKLSSKKLSKVLELVTEYKFLFKNRTEYKIYIKDGEIMRYSNVKNKKYFIPILCADNSKIYFKRW